MRVPDLLAPSERRLAALLFGLALAGYGLRLGERLSPGVARWLEEEGRPATAPATGTTPPSSAAAGPSGAVPSSLPEGAPPASPSAPPEPADSIPRPPSRLVDPNRAGEGDLVRLPGVGPVLARRIVEERERSGPFRSPEDLLRVRGIGPATLRGLRPLLRFGNGTDPVPSPRAGGGAPPPG